MQGPSAPPPTGSGITLTDAGRYFTVKLDTAFTATVISTYFTII